MELEHSKILIFEAGVGLILPDPAFSAEFVYLGPAVFVGFSTLNLSFRFAIVLHSPLPSIILLYSNADIHFYHSKEGRRLSQPGWLISYTDGLPAHRQFSIRVLFRFGIQQLGYHYAMLLTSLLQ